MCARLASSTAVRREVQAILRRGSADPMFLGALKWATEHGYGKPKETHEITGSLTLEQIVVGAKRKG